MTPKQSLGSSPATAAIIFRQSQEAFIDQLRLGEPVKMLEGDARLEAALLVGCLYDRALASRSSQEIREELADLDRGGEPFRIHRWMIRTPEHKLSDELRKFCANRSEPQKKIRTYLALVDRLARMIGDDPFARVWELLEATRLNERFEHTVTRMIPGEIEPRQRLAALLNDHAIHLAEVLDLPGLWQKAEKLQRGWDMNLGPIPISIDQGIMQNHFRSDVAATQLQWLSFEAPAYPSVKIARLPYGLFDGPFEVMRAVPDARDPVLIKGQLALYCDLWLMIAPSGKYGVGSYLSRTPGFGLILANGSSVPLTAPQGAFIDNVFTLSYSANVLQPIIALPSAEEGSFELQPEEAYSLSFPEERFQAIIEKPDVWAICTHPLMRGAPEDVFDEEMPFIRTSRVAPKTINDWLVLDFTMDGPGRHLPQIRFFSGGSAKDTLGWIAGDCAARDLEQTLHNGVLDQTFTSWASSYRSALDQIEADWTAKAAAAEIQLRKRWKEERIKLL